MQDPYFAVKEEVENSVAVVVELHQKWLALGKGDEFDWTSSELLSGLRSIEWDLQDLEDTVSIVEGNRVKFQLEESDILERKQFIDVTRKQIVAIRDEVQGLGGGESSGFSTSKSLGLPSIPSISKAKGYGKVGSEDPLPPADDDLEGGKATAIASSNAADEILGTELDAGDGDPDPGRHRRKKACLGLAVLLILAAVLGGAVTEMATAPNANPATTVPSSSTGMSTPASPLTTPTSAPPSMPLAPSRVRRSRRSLLIPTLDGEKADLN
mmetsp:Transcript_44375/g.116595  ORF Transcript_44375/g.116595 Transcript_44375/m.116595 type:complete len:269 (+) Transcript_44375:106-912(+)